MAKLQFLLNKDTSYMYYDDPKYTELSIRATIDALCDQLMFDGLITVKEALKKFGLNTKEIPMETLLHYWSDDVDISYQKTEKDDEFLLIFETDG